MNNRPPFPLATYRIQLNHKFTFQNLGEIISYLDEIGFSHIYTSPLLMAKAGSLHGYDIVDPSQLNPEIGTVEQFNELIEKIHHLHMGLIVDIVPNHMSIKSHNPYWQDILENGQESPYASFFDIDWHPVRDSLKNKILLPLLDRHYGQALEEKIMQIRYLNGAFYISSHELAFMLPTNPNTWDTLLSPLLEEVGKLYSESSSEYLELNSILGFINELKSFENLQNHETRYSKKNIIKESLKAFFQRHPLVEKMMTDQISAFNGIVGNPKSFDPLDAFIDSQYYRLSDWRIANDEVNYRRFFDIFEYAGIRVELSDVFEATHRIMYELYNRDKINGFRIDHIDGLWNPLEYLSKLREKCLKNDPYIVAEKILISNEQLRTEWPLQGTVGYDFLNQLNGLFIFQINKESFINIYRQFTAQFQNPSEIAFECKKTVLGVSLPSELQMLAKRLDEIASSHRDSIDFTFISLKTALTDIIACFPVYRTYIDAFAGKVSDSDREIIQAAVKKATRKNPAISKSHYEFICSLLLLEEPSGVSDEMKALRKEFVMRFQQFTGPVMAKGIEDTAFYRYFPLCSVNEVGGDIHTFGISLNTFHQKNLERSEHWPNTMLTTSTHDTKRSEDVRGRINVLSEIPAQWEQALLRWKTMNLIHKCRYEGELAPDPNEEYHLYQMLIGTWPLVLQEDDHLSSGYIERLQIYMEKAIREAKINSSWLNPNEGYDNGIKSFVEKILDRKHNSEFFSDFNRFAYSIADFGMLNSLQQILLKCTCPGVPDFYQGSEAWNFTMVDPDNRSPINYVEKQQILQSIRNETLETLLSYPRDGRIKLYMIHSLLNFRKTHSEIFRNGIYLPLNVVGPKQNHIIAFARVYEANIVIVAAARFFTFLMSDFMNYLEEDIWRGTSIELPPELANRQYEELLSQTKMRYANSIPVDILFKKLPMELIYL